MTVSYVCQCHVLSILGLSRTPLCLVAIAGNMMLVHIKLKYIVSIEDDVVEKESLPRMESFVN